MTQTDLLDIHKWRFACKEFNPEKKISNADFNQLLEVIRLSPSSFGLQPFQVIVLQNQDLRLKLKSTMWGAQKQLPSASHFIMFVTRKNIQYYSPYINNMVTNVQKTPENLLELRFNLIKNHQINDAHLLDNPRYLTDWAGKQSYLALGNLMTAAAQMGIDSCPIEGFDALKTTQLLVEEHVIDPQTQELCVFCALGYRQEGPLRTKTRQDISNLTAWYN
ncbi:MAG: NAD(P)H-dependent oxidoreductase [Burkholderiaceae bacterium]|nr:NAD(P)H-dependent oxidoreductase [Burkholderiaceae bacterium]